MTKYNVLISYVCESDSELEAIFALNKTLRPLSENELEKFNAFLVEEITQWVFIKHFLKVETHCFGFLWSVLVVVFIYS